MALNNLKSYSIKAILKSIRGKEALLVLEDGQTIIWPTQFLPKDVKKGSFVFLFLETEEDLEKRQRNLARQILNEILEN